MEKRLESALLFTPLPLPEDGFFMEIGISKAWSPTLSFITIRPFYPTFEGTQFFSKKTLVQNCRSEIERVSASWSQGGSDNQYQEERVLFGNVSSQRPERKIGYPFREILGNQGQGQYAIF